MEFKHWFCLRQRETFTIDPKINPSDAQFYFGRQVLADRMRRQISHAFIDPQVPKMMVWGPYGSGKTQTLYYLSYWLQHDKPSSCKLTPYPIHLDIEMQSKSTAVSWHTQNMEGIRMQTFQEWVQQLHSSSNFDQEISTITDDPNLKMALGHLRGGGGLSYNAWRWLSAQKLSTAELRDIMVTRNLGEIGVGDMVNILQACGRLAKAVGICLILFIDEMEELLNVRDGDAASSWHHYIRKLAEPANSSVGFVIGFKADTIDEAPRMIIRPDVKSRIGAHNYIELDTFPAVANVQQFVKEMLGHLVDQGKATQVIQTEGLAGSTTIDTYPFTTSAFDRLCDYACMDPIHSTPRNIIRAINECAIAAWDAEKRVVDDGIVDDIAPIVFS